jgi:Centromere DNA-binding protein complex CBF3 subunit, domain 2/Transcriptional activator of glycolytic enzymes
MQMGGNRRRNSTVSVSSPGSPGGVIGSPSSLLRLRHPNDVALNSLLEETILEMREEGRPANTAKTMDNKIREFFQFCDLQYPNDPYNYILEFEKVYRFMFYQSFREQKKRGGSKQERLARAQGDYFDNELYVSIVSRFNSIPDEGPDVPRLFPIPKNPIGVSTFDMYKAVFRKIYKVQLARKVNERHWEQIWQLGLDELYHHVKERAPKLKKETYQEKVDGAFSPYSIVEHYDKIEAQFWDDSNTQGRRSIHCALRHRFCILYLTSGILRSESLYRAELSDFLCFKCPKLETDVHDLFLMINQIPVGKTTHGKVQYGRATRHKNVVLCAVGAMAFYLTFRFYCTKEFADFTVDDWLDNTKWFDVKLLVDINGTDFKKEMSNDGYSDHVKRVLAMFNLVCTKLLHLGRNLGAKILDLLQEESEAIRRMGQWMNSVFDNSYSSKLPMAPIRKLAGYHDSKFYFNTRTTVIPDEELLRSTPMGKWCYDALNGVVSHVRAGEKQTALHVLHFFCEMNCIMIQDAAAMMILEPNRSNHAMFHDMTVFSSDKFMEFKEQMRIAIDSEKCPLDANLEYVLPGVHQWHNLNNAAVKVVGSEVEQLKVAVAEGFIRVEKVMNNHRAESDKRIAASFLSIARDLLHDASAETVRDNSRDQSREQEVGSPSSSTGPSFSETENNERAQTQASDDSAEYHRGFRMENKHKRLTALWDEWHGTGDFVDDFGGVKGRDKKHGSKWRRHINNMHHSRTKRVVEAIECFASQSEIHPSEACSMLQAAFESVNCSIANFVEKCQDEGLIPKKKARGKGTKSVD